MTGGYYSLKREIGVPIPDDLSPDDWCLFTMCVPNDPQWFLAVRNAVRFLTLGRYWARDDRDNSIRRAQSLGEEILGSFDMCNIDLSGIAAALESMALAIGNIQQNVTVTQNCSGGGGGLVCIGEDGTPIVNPPPIEPDPIPPGGDWPVDPDVDPPPGEDEDWTYFDARACAVSNSIYQLLVYMTIALEGIIDTLVTLAAGIIAFLALFPAAAAAAIGGASIIEIVGALVDLLSIEAIADVLQEAKAYVEDNQAEIVCLIYNNRYNLPGLRNEFASRLVLAVTAVVSLTPSEQEQLRQFGRKMLPMSLLYRWFYEAGAYIDAVNPYDCQNCEESSNWDTGTETFEDSNGLFLGTSERVLYTAQNCPSPDSSLYGRFFNPRQVDQSVEVYLYRQQIDNLDGVASEDDVMVTHIDFDLYIGASYAPKVLYLRVNDGLGGYEDTDLLELGTPGSWSSVSITNTVVSASILANYVVVGIVGLWNNNNDTTPAPTNQCLIDNIRVRGVVV